MGAIGLNPIRLDRIGLDPIRINAIKLGVPGASGTERPYIDPEVLASLKAVCICYGKSNDDPDRAVVKNLVDPDNPFVISNAAYDKMSSYGGYEFAKFDNTLDWYNTEGNDSVEVVSRNGHSITLKRLTGPNFWYFQNSTFRGLISNVIPFKVNSNKNIAVIWDVHGLSISEGKDKSVRVQELVLNPNEDNYTNLKTLNEEELAQIDISTNSLYYLLWFDLSTLAVDEEVTIEMLPLFEGAFVTDGIDDLITSTKTAEEMGITDEVTVISMIHQIGGINSSAVNYGYTNYFRGINQSTLRNNAIGLNKTGIYGYSATNYTPTVINNILGDKNDYTTNSAGFSQFTYNNVFSVEGYKISSTIAETSQVAWYWTIIANKVLTTDQINQVIAYFNLDRTLKPDILCNVKKQGITNENHAEFGDRLIDFSGNGRDIQLNNIAWDGDSGIGKYNYPNWKVNVTQGNKYARIVYYDSINGTYSANFKGITDLYNSYGLSIEIRVNRANTVDFHSIKEDGIYTMTPPDDTTSIDIRFGGENVYNASCDITITQIPSHAGALCLDGVNDFGKVTGMPIYKDYTFISKYQRLSYREAIEIEGGAVIASKSYSPNQGAFIFNGVRGDYVHDCYSFGLSSSNNLINDKNLEVYYQTKYTNQGKSISSGTAADSDILWLGTVRDNDTRFINAAIYFLMSFPYSMSEFLIERQLKKHKLGTLYPDMVEFRPIIKQDDRIKSIKYYIDGKTANIGQYYPIGTGLGIAVETVQPYMVKSLKVNGVNTIPNADYKGFNARLDSKSPQKITMDIVVDTSIILFNPTINSNAIFEVGNEQNMTELIAKVRNHEIDGFIMYLSKLESKYILPNSWINKDTEVISYIYCLDNILQDDLHINIDGNSKYCLYADSSNNIAEFIIMDDNIFEEQYITNVLTVNTIDIQLDQYIRYEDIVQPYPVLLRFNDENGNEVSWGGKFRVGSTITRIGSFYENNLIDGLYIVRNPKLNGNNLITPTHVVEKSMVFTCDTEYLLDNNEPKCILSPSRLRMPNSSYKILGYIPDISGHGNHGVIHNSAYAKGSGVNEDGSYQFDGVDDHVTIPTLSRGGKQVLMKVNWESGYGKVLYDQRLYTSGLFAIITISEAPAYEGGNGGGKTYIDGILNKNILSKELASITHNITLNNNTVTNSNIFIGTDYAKMSYAKMALYDFMLFENISTDDKIKELNEYVGIEGNTDDLFNETNI